MFKEKVFEQKIRLIFKSAGIHKYIFDNNYTKNSLSFSLEIQKKLNFRYLFLTARRLKDAYRGQIY